MNRAAGPSTAAVQPLEFAKKDQVFRSTLAEDVLDYSIITSNNVSMARDMLANERNWLTWFRLSCTLVILGFTILLQFRLPSSSSNESDQDHNNPKQPIGYIFIAVGLGCFFVGLGKYFKNQNLLIQQATHVEAGWGSYVMAGILAIFACTIMILASSSNFQ
ncbi:hypothetical protein G6F37_009864 [Rhizopus arrhizus]|nr:hypothetical protein G6F38_010472 [Rhizopus arrhizus]KAG1153984.1 hypothetical protein G6F37_009864 [Rhizopus arrhizus]